ncbi:MAG TPA: ATP-binding protein [Pseudonocardia sp.]|nr:ATP-binding protein [Pseudonocardia sp.]
MSQPDPFDTAGLRAAVLAAWASSPTRFREDANVEEDLRIDGYADAWFVELAQNAADAARAGRAPGRIRVQLVPDGDGGELAVANTGAGLTAAGVAALTSLRASAKRDDTASVGRFGVGFTAVLAVTDAPRVVGTGGGVAFSAARTAAAVAGLAGPAAELARRDEPPVLRLAWPTAEAPATGFDTEVRLPLRPGIDGAALLEQARSCAADLLLVLPELVEIDVAGTVLRRADGPGPGELTIGTSRWRLVRGRGALDATDAGAQAVEQRARREWTVCWALPLTGDGHPAPPAADVLHAPTATGERLGLPARLIASLPLEPDRRRVRPGPVTDQVLAAAARTYVELVLATPPAQRLALVPAPGFPRSELDGRLRELLLDALRGASWLPAAQDGVALVPARAEWLDLPGAGPQLHRLLPEAGFDRLLAALPGSGGAPGALLAELGMHRCDAGEMVARLLGVQRPAGWWRALYAALEPLVETVPGLLDELRALPVPLADGRTVAGPATVLLPPGPAGDGRDTADGADPGGRECCAVLEHGAALTGLSLPGLHIGDPDAVHPLLARLGAGPADPAALLAHPALLAAVERSVDDADAGLDPAPLAAAVLGLVTELGTGGVAPGGLGALALPDAEGVPARADELMLPDAALRPLLAADTPIGVLDPDWAARLPRSSLTAAGVLDGFALVVDEEPAAPDHDLDDEERWWDGLESPPSRLVAVRDLDLVDADAWSAALTLLAATRETRAAVTAPGSYTGWWLRRHARLGGHRPSHYRLAAAQPLAALFDPVPAADVDEAFLAAIGVRSDLEVSDVTAAAELLRRLADPARSPDPALVADAHAELAAAVAAGRVEVERLTPPQRVRALDGSVVGVDDAVVLDAPWPAAVLSAGELVFGGDPVALADLLDLPLATEVVAGEVQGTGSAVGWSELSEVVVACQRLGLARPAGRLRLHDELWVRVSGPVSGRFRVPVWVDPAGIWHAEDPVRALLAAAVTDHA